MDLTLRFLRRSWDTVALGLAVVACLAASVPLSRSAAWIPRIVLAITLALLVVQLVREARELSAIAARQRRPATSAAGAADDASAISAGPDAPSTRMTSPVLAVLWVCGSLLCVLVLGAAPGSMLYAFAYLRWHARATWLNSVIFAVALGACLQFAFSVVLHVELYRGWLWNAVQ